MEETNGQKIYLAILMLAFMTIATFIATIPTNNSSNAINTKEIVNAELMPYIEFKQHIEDKNINQMYMQTEHDDFYFLEYDNKLYKIVNPQYDTFKKELLENDIQINTTKELIAESKGDSSLFLFVTWVITCTVIGCLLLWVVFTKRNTNPNKTVMQIQSGTPKETTNKEKSTIPTKTFKDVAGLKEVKKDMDCVVDFLKNGEKYRNMGATLPTGIILYGPPGTGKTLLAKAVAGEAKVPFFYMNGSDFIEKYVGVGPQRVRELFKEAKKSAPCIIFIDEIDAIGGSRDENDSTSEDRKTINALLAEMDGFGTNKEKNILVIGATNRIEDLDKALLRAGRFTEKYCVPLPYSVEEREEIINIYKTNKKFDETVDFNQIAKDTIGNSPAEIEALLNESAIIAVQDYKKAIDKESIEKAFTKQILHGHIKEEEKKKDEELKLVAWHEAGHALIGKLLGLDVSKVTIKSTTTGAGGVTFTNPSKFGLYSIEDLKSQVKQLYAGRCAEYLFYNDWNKTTTGTSNDIEKATKILYDMVSTYGMTESYDMLNLRILNIPNDRILNDCKSLAKELKQTTLDMLVENKVKLQEIVENLLLKDTIYGEDLDKIINSKQEDLLA